MNTNTKKPEINQHPEPSEISSVGKMNSLRIKVLTFNFFLRPPGINNIKSDRKTERLKLLKSYIKNYDVVCLQEVFGCFSFRKFDLIKYASEVGFQYFAESPSPGFFSRFFMCGGLLTLSKYPINYSNYLPYKNGSNFDKLTKKGCLYTRININNSVIHVFNTHLQASYALGF